MLKMVEQPTYFSILPASVRYDKNLTDSEKILFSELTVLSNKYGYATASNNYFADLYGVHKDTVSRRINKLKRLGYLKVDLIYNGNQIKERRIYPITTSLEIISGKQIEPVNSNKKTVDEPIDNSVGIDRTADRGIDNCVDRGIDNPDDRGIGRIVVGNNTRFNNTSMNNTSINNNHDNGNKDIDHDFKEVVNLWHEYGFGMITQRSTEMILDWLNLHDKNLIIEVLKYAHDSNKRNSRYVQVVLKNLRDRNIKTAEDFISENKNFKQSKPQHSNNHKYVQAEGEITEIEFENQEDIDF